MEKLRFTLSFLALLLVASLALSCGASSHGQGQLQSIALSPPTAVAQSVQFTATGYYIHPSYTVTPQPATWGACYQGTPTTEVSVTAAGIAQCASGATGTYTVFAFDAIPPCDIIANHQCGTGCTIVGTAQLTCP
jgi:hypothetical protein